MARAKKTQEKLESPQVFKYVSNMDFEGYAEGKLFKAGELNEFTEERANEIQTVIQSKGFKDFTLEKVVD